MRPRGLAALAVALVAAAPGATGRPAVPDVPTVRVGAPRVVADAADLDPPDLPGRTRPDAPPVRLPDGRTLVSHVSYRPDASGTVRGFVEHVMLDGPPGDPYRSTAWRKRTCRRAGTVRPDERPDGARHPLACVDAPRGDRGVAFPGLGGADDVVALWFVGAHAPDGAAPGELIGFLHEERIGASGGVAGDREGTTALALARSRDGGDTWRYLGRIATAHGVGGVGPPGAPGPRTGPRPGAARPHNVQGAPFVVDGGRYLVYHVDRNRALDHPGIAVSRAPVADVLARARRGSVGDVWEKLSTRPDGARAWARASTDPAPAYVMEKPAWASPDNRRLWPLRLWGITHAQALTREADGHHFTVLTSAGSDGGTPDDPSDDAPTWVRLFGSRDGLLWEPLAWLAGDSASAGGRHGYQYCALAGAEGLPNGRFVDAFDVDCVREGPVGSGRAAGGGRGSAQTRDRDRALVRWRVTVPDAGEG